MKKSCLVFLVSIFLSVYYSCAQPYSLKVSIKNQPDNPVVLGTINGDKFLPVDTLELLQVTGSSTAKNNSGTILQVTPSHLKNVKKAVWRFPANADSGVYRLVLGQTTYAKVMGEPPQQLDFIFNKEDIVFETDFKAPRDSLKVIRSKENRVWFDFFEKEQWFKDELELLEKEVDYYHSKLAESAAFPGIENESVKQEMETHHVQKANVFNQLQMERNMFVEKMVNENQNLFAARLIQTFREPFRDGYLTAEERKKSVQQESLMYVDFSDESLINSPVLTDKVFDYLVSYNRSDYTREQREEVYIKAVDEVMAHVQNANVRVYEFILNYLVNGFERLGMENVLSYIAENYGDSLCRTDEKTTLERKLEYQKMKPGTHVSDFTLNDLNGNPVTLSHVLESRNLILFWASWCPHCIELLPRIKTWFRQFDTGNFEVITISLDTSEKEWKDAVTAARLEAFYNLSDLNEWEGSVVENYNVYATPAMFLIDETRKILAKPKTFEELLKSAGR